MKDFFTGEDKSDCENLQFDVEYDIPVTVIDKPTNMKKSINKMEKQGMVFNCHMCSKIFFEIEKIKRHFRAVHEGHKDYKCE